ncbi:hypothetical protein ACJW30_05G096300 [Castanea mollissima]
MQVVYSVQEQKISAYLSSYFIFTLTKNPNWDGRFLGNDFPKKLQNYEILTADHVIQLFKINIQCQNLHKAENQIWMTIQNSDDAPTANRSTPLSRKETQYDTFKILYTKTS